MESQKRSRQQTFRYRAAIIFGLIAILPLLLFLFILKSHDLLMQLEVVIVLGLSLLIAVLGYAFFQSMVRQISSLAEDFQKVESGELRALGDRADIHEVSEMARIADAFNRILDELKSNTKELENLIYKLTTLSELTELVSRIPDIKEVLDTVLRRAMMTVNARIGSIMLVDEKAEVLSVAATVGLGDDVTTGTEIPLREGIAGRVARSGETILGGDAEEDPHFAELKGAESGSTSFICLPLRAHERVIGVLTLSKKGDRTDFSEYDLKFLTTLLTHIGFAVENARLLKEAKEAATKLQEVVEEQGLQLVQVQKQVIQAAKLSALGELVAGVTHEINNPLTAIIGFSQLLYIKIEDGKLRKDLKQIIDEGQRAAKIVQNLLSFARQNEPEKRMWSIHETLYKVLDILAYDLRLSGIEVRTEFDESLPPTMVDANQIQQVFLNIANNARQAMGEQMPPKDLVIRTESDGKLMKIHFRDNGPGMSTEQLERVFDPFFTTKSQGKGTGLGLSISYGIVKAHEGDIYVRSLEGKGATFTVELPVVSECVDPLEKVVQVMEAVNLPVERLLVIEDEAAISDLITSLLEQEGCRVDSAGSGKIGLKKVLENEYDLILCDIRMPGMDGKEVYQEATASRPELAHRFVFLTGDIVSEETRTFLGELDNFCIMKPFSREDFIGILAKAWEQVPGIGESEES